MSSQSASKTPFYFIVSRATDSGELSSDPLDDKKSYAVADYLRDRAVKLYNDFQQNQCRIESNLPDYYIAVQRSFIHDLTHTIPDDAQRAAVEQLFVKSYVLGAQGGSMTEACKAEFDTIKAEICQAVVHQSNINVVRAYTGDRVTPDARLRINAQILLDHKLGWMSDLAHKDGAAYATSGAIGTRSSKQPSP